MIKTMNVSITNIPSISAIYYALLQSGYDYYSTILSDNDKEVLFKK